MQDLLYIAVTIAFFVVAGLFVVACDRIIGSDEAALAEVQRGAPEAKPGAEKVAA
jgi:hypothetical protein